MRTINNGRLVILKEAKEKPFSEDWENVCDNLRAIGLEVDLSKIAIVAERKPKRVGAHLG